MQLRRALGLLPLALLFLAWHLATYYKVYPPVLLAPPAKVLAVFVDDLPTLLEHALSSLARVTVGIGCSFVVAVPLGLLIGRYGILDMLTDWSIQIFRSVPPISLISSSSMNSPSRSPKDSVPVVPLRHFSQMLGRVTHQHNCR